MGSSAQYRGNLSTEAMLTIVARRRLRELGIGYYTLGFACTNGRETREALLRAIAQVDEEIQDVYMPRQALMQFVDDFMQVSTSGSPFGRSLFVYSSSFSQHSGSIFVNSYLYFDC